MVPGAKYACPATYRIYIVRHSVQAIRNRMEKECSTNRAERGMYQVASGRNEMGATYQKRMSMRKNC